MSTYLTRGTLTLSLLALLSLTQTASADPTGGPIVGISRAPAYGATLHKVLYNGGQQADFIVVGDGDTTLNVIVRDANGFEIVRTTGPGDRCRVTWFPGRTAVFFISVVNQGSVYNEYAWKAY